MADQSNKRAHMRRKLSLLIRFITQSDLETSGRVRDISEGGLYMESHSSAGIGDDVILYPEGLGRLSGKIVRKGDDGVAVEFILSDVQREYLSRRIASAEAGVPYLKLMEKRQHVRVDLKVDSRASAPSIGKEFDCTIVDLSLTGALIRSTVKPPLGVEVRIGAIRGLVRRHWEDGFAIKFVQVAVA